MPFFGTNTVLGSTFTLNRGGPQWCIRYTPASSGHVYQVSGYLAGQVGTNANYTIDIYSDNGARTQPGSLLASSSSTLITTSLPAQWITLTISCDVVKGVDYWLCPRLQNAGASGVTIYADSTVSTSRAGIFTQQSSPASGFSLTADPFGSSIYADYVETLGVGFRQSGTAGPMSVRFG